MYHDLKNGSSLTALLAIFLLSFASPLSAEQDQAKGIKLLEATLEAHGGLEGWSAYRSFTYRMVGFPLTPQVAEPSVSRVDLRSRYNRIESQLYTVGWNGSQAWATPGPDAVGLPPRFYTLGSFYFIGMPFVFADPGVELSELGTKSLDGKTYQVLKAAYVDGVGHSDDDDYRLFVDPETHRLAMIDHSVTETGVERVTWTFDRWQRVGALLVPRQMTFYPGSADQITGDGSSFTIEDAELDRRPIDPAIYQPPRNAVITSAP